jgi:sugar-specific transcriptional regulator TrmB
MEKIKAALRRLELSDNEQAIYLSLLREGQAGARVLAARTAITRPSVYDQLKSLITLGLVVELDIEGKALFAAADIKYLDALLADRIDRLTQSRESLAESLSELQLSLETVTPKLRFFEGGEGIKQLLKDIMWHDNTTLHIIWPMAAMNEVFDGAFLRWFDERRQKRHLPVHVLWPFGTKVATQTLFTTGEKDSSRVLVKGASIPMASIIYANKVANISSSAEAFGFIVESKEFATSERVKFDALWRASSTT